MCLSEKHSTDLDYQPIVLESKTGNDYLAPDITTEGHKARFKRACVPSASKTHLGRLLLCTNVADNLSVEQPLHSKIYHSIAHVHSDIHPTQGQHQSIMCVRVRHKQRD